MQTKPSRGQQMWERRRGLSLIVGLHRVSSVILLHLPARTCLSTMSSTRLHPHHSLPAPVVHAAFSVPQSKSHVLAGVQDAYWSDDEAVRFTRLLPALSVLISSRQCRRTRNALCVSRKWTFPISTSSLVSVDIRYCVPLSSRRLLVTSLLPDLSFLLAPHQRKP